MTKEEIICKNCGKKFLGYSYPNKPRVYCSKKCQNEAQKIKFKGSGNPNFGKKWNTMQRERASEYRKKIMLDQEKRYACGSANRGKKLSEERKINMCGHTPWNKGKTGIFSEETLAKIGQKSKEKFDNKEFLEKYKQTMIERGYWRENIPQQEIYYKLANWKTKMFDKITDKNQLLKLKENGVFNSHTNKKGMVRDHIFGRRSGYKNGVYPEILRHPCNCQLLTNLENIKKKTDRYIDRNDITLEELFNKIENYNGDWDEQDLVLKLIQKYKNGERWTINEVSK